MSTDAINNAKYAEWTKSLQPLCSVGADELVTGSIGRSVVNELDLYVFDDSYRATQFKTKPLVGYECFNNFERKN